MTDILSIDGVRVEQSATGQYAIHQYKDYIGNPNKATLEWDGRCSLAPSKSTFYLQIYNVVTGWETLASNNTAGIDEDFTLITDIADLTNYKDVTKVITCRVYQLSI